MNRTHRRWRYGSLLSYGIATIAVALATWLRLALDPVIGPGGPIAILLLAVAVAAYFGGIGPGVFASAATTLTGVLLFLSVDGRVAELGARTQIYGATHLLVALAITWLCHRLQQSAEYNRKVASDLAESRLRLSIVLESVTDGFLAVRRDWALTRVNPESRRLLQLPDSHVLGPSLWDATPRWLGTDIEAALRKAMESQASDGVESYDPRHDQWLDVRAFPSEEGLVVYLRDITGRRKHEEELARISLERARAYAKLDALLENAPVGLSYFDKDRRYLRINNFFARMNGLYAPDVIGKTLREVLPELAPVLEPLIDEVFATGRAIQNTEVEGETPHEPGVRRAWLASFYPVTDAGEVDAVGTIVTEITERKRGESLLRESEERYRSLVSASSSLIWTADQKGEFVVPQLAWKQFTGQAESDQLGLGWLDVFHPDDQKRIESEWRQALGLKHIYQSHARLFSTQANEYRHAALRAAPVLNIDRTVREWVGTVQDVHEPMVVEQSLRRSEERNRLLIDNAAAMVWSTGSHGKIRKPQPKWEAYTGQSWPSQKNLKWMDAVHPDDREELHTWIRRSEASPAPVFFDIRLWHAESGEYRFANVHCVPLLGEDGRPTEWIWMALDKHEQKMWEQERDRILASERAARHDAEKANRLKDEFIATMSHELRTPLTTILGWSELLQHKLDHRSTLLQGLQTIERSTRLQAQLIEDLLDASRIGAGKLRLEIQDMDMAESVLAGVESLRSLAGEKGVEIETAIVDQAPVRADPERLTQIVWNILSNAVKFTGPGGSVRISLKCEGPSAILTVEDSGEGIDPAFLPQIFDRFRQADSSTSRRHGGLGLGLSIVQQLVEMLGGKVSAESEGVGLGARFIVTLPRAQTGTGRSPQMGAAKLANVKGLRLMLIDDDPDTCDVLARLLEESGAEVHSFMNVKGALLAFDEVQPNVVISDLGMPDQDGFELIRQLRARESGGDVPAVAVTAFAGPGDKLAALKAGFDAHVPKPVDAEQLFSVIRAVSKLRT